MRGSGYQREHTWPRSYGFPSTSSMSGPFTDCHQLRLCDPGYNQSRSNKVFSDCAPGCTEEPTNRTNGIGGGSGVYPGNSNWTSGSFTNGNWQVWGERKGDVARGILYMDIRYEGGAHSGTGAQEPDLRLTDNRTLIANSNTGSNESVAYMGLLSALLRWHAEDPPDAAERARNDVVFQFQGNRNPFVDNPQWVDILWNGATGGTPGVFEAYGTGCPTSSLLVPQLFTTGEPRINSTLTIVLASGPALAPVALHLAFAPSSTNLSFLGFPACNLLALPDIQVAASASIFGGTFVSLPIPNDNNMVGLELRSQWIAAETPFHLSLSNGGRIVIGSAP